MQLKCCKWIVLLLLIPHILHTSMAQFRSDDYYYLDPETDYEDEWNSEAIDPAEQSNKFPFSVFERSLFPRSLYDSAFAMETTTECETEGPPGAPGAPGGSTGAPPPAGAQPGEAKPEEGGGTSTAAPPGGATTDASGTVETTSPGPGDATTAGGNGNATTAAPGEAPGGTTVPGGTTAPGEATPPGGTTLPGGATTTPGPPGAPGTPDGVATTCKPVGDSGQIALPLPPTTTPPTTTPSMRMDGTTCIPIPTGGAAGYDPGYTGGGPGQAIYRAAEDQEGRTRELHQLVQRLYVAQARVQLEAIEIKKAQAVANSAQQQLEEAANHVRSVTAALQTAQQEVASAAIRAQTAQLQLAAHDQLLFAARQDVDALSSQMVGLQAAEGIATPGMKFDVHGLLDKLKQPLSEGDKPTPVPPVVVASASRASSTGTKHQDYYDYD